MKKGMKRDHMAMPSKQGWHHETYPAANMRTTPAGFYDFHVEMRDAYPSYRVDPSRYPGDHGTVGNAYLRSSEMGERKTMEMERKMGNSERQPQ